MRESRAKMLSEREKADLLLLGPLGRAVLAEILGAEPYLLAQTIGFVYDAVSPRHENIAPSVCPGANPVKR
jgi:hypothetical protein